MSKIIYNIIIWNMNIYFKYLISYLFTTRKSVISDRHIRWKTVGNGLLWRISDGSDRQIYMVRNFLAVRNGQICLTENRRIITVGNFRRNVCQKYRSETSDRSSGRKFLTGVSVRKNWRKSRSESFDGIYGQKYLTESTVIKFWRVVRSDISDRFIGQKRLFRLKI